MSADGHLSYDTEKLILALVNNHIIFSRINNGLSEIGLNTEDFPVSLGSTIFDLMGLGNDEMSDEWFSEFCQLQMKPCSLIVP